MRDPITMSAMVINLHKREVATMRMSLLLVCLGILLFVPDLANSADPQLPSAGFAAEVRGAWEEAATAYEKALEKAPERLDLWLRTADIRARQGRPELVIKALEGAIATNKSDPKLYNRLSQAYAVNKQPKKALDAINKALELAPDNINYLQAKAALANWARDPRQAIDAYKKALELQPGDDNLRLKLAQQESWAGELDDAADLYAEYLEKNPDDANIWLDYVKVQSWRGNYSKALAALDEYKKRFGETDAYKARLARIYTWDSKANTALEIIDTLLKKDPNNYEYNFTRTLALARARRPDDVPKSLEVVEKSDPSNPRTESLRRVALISQRSFVDGDINFYNDSDDIDRLRLHLNGAWFLTPSTNIAAGGRWGTLNGGESSGLGPADGGDSVDYSLGWLGAWHRFSPWIALQGRIGPGKVRNGDSFYYWQGIADLNPADTFNIRLTATNDLFDVSPRAVSLTIEETKYALYWDWMFSETGFFAGNIAWSQFSDDNQRWEVGLGPRWAVARTQLFNIDVGPSLYAFGFDKDLNNGYYDPGTYHFISAQAFMYLKLSDDNGISLQGDVGLQHDENMDGYDIGWDIIGRGIIGIYKDLMIEPYASATNRQSQSGAFESYQMGLRLTWRF